MTQRLRRLQCVALLVCCSLSPCLFQTDKNIPAKGILSFKPPVIRLSVRQPVAALSIKCSHPQTLQTSYSRLSLKLTRRPLEGGRIEVLCESDSSGLFIDTAFEDTLQAEGNYTTSITVRTQNATCNYTTFRYRCFSGVRSTSGRYLRHEDTGTVGAEVVSPQPKLTFKPDNGTSLAEGQKLNMTCTAAIALVTDSVPSRWVWDTKSGSGSWTTVPSSSNTTRKQDCFVLGSSSHVAVIRKENGSCTQKFRCYVAKGSRRFVGTAGNHSVTIVGCEVSSPVSSMDRLALLLAIAGTCVLITGILAVVNVARARRKVDRLRKMMAQMQM